MGVSGRELRASEEVERLIQAPRRAMGVVGVVAGGGVTGLEFRGPVYCRSDGVRVRPVVVRLTGVMISGVAGRGFVSSGAENAEPISESVSERTCIRIEGAR